MGDLLSHFVSHSFAWLSGQVHSNMLLHFSGRIAESFDREFRCLYADSQIIDYFHNPDEEGLPFYPSYPPLFNQSRPREFQERGNSREKQGSDHSSSQSSSSLSSIKKAPGMAATVYQVTHDTKSPEGRRSQSPDLHTPTPEKRGHHSPTATANAQATDRRAHQSPIPNAQGAERRGRQIPGAPATRGYYKANGHSGSAEWGAGQAGAERNKAAIHDYRRCSLEGMTARVQGLNLYDHKQNYYHGGVPKTTPPTDPKAQAKHKNTAAPILNKISDFFLPPHKERDGYNFRQSPPLNTAFGGPDLTQAEPESHQPLPPPPPLSPIPDSPTDAKLHRQDVKRMTLGHSKLDLVNHYNKMKTKHIYSRFELKDNN